MTRDQHFGDWCYKHNRPDCYFCAMQNDPFDLPLVAPATEKNTCDCGGYKCKTTHANWCAWHKHLERREKEKEAYVKWRNAQNTK